MRGALAAGRRRLARFGTVALAGLGLAGLAACGDASGADAFAGTYTMRSVNGQALPFIYYQQPDATESIAEGRIVLDADGTYTDRTVYHLVAPDGRAEDQVDVVRGTYVLDRDIVTFTDRADGSEYSMVVKGRTLVQTLSPQGVSYVFRFARE